MQDKSIDGALLALRKQIIRGDIDGLAHVEALLALRGVHMPAVLPAKRKDVAGKGVMAAIILEVLTDVAARRPKRAPEFAYGRTVRVPSKMKRRGLVGNTKRVGWHVVQDFGLMGACGQLQNTLLTPYNRAFNGLLAIRPPFFQAARCQYPFQFRDTGASIALDTTMCASVPLSVRWLSSSHAAWFAYWCRYLGDTPWCWPWIILRRREKKLSTMLVCLPWSL